MCQLRPVPMFLGMKKILILPITGILALSALSGCHPDETTPTPATSTAVVPSPGVSVSPSGAVILPSQVASLAASDEASEQPSASASHRRGGDQFRYP